MSRPNWFRTHIVDLFINSDGPAVVTSLLMATAAMVLVPDFVRAKYLAVFNGIPATFLALMGFVLTAAAIVVSVQDKGMIRLFKRHKPREWKLTKRVFFPTARLFGLFGVAILILGNAPLTQIHGAYHIYVERGFLGTVVAACFLSAFQLNKMIYVLSKLMDAAQDEEQAIKLEADIKKRGPRTGSRG